MKLESNKVEPAIAVDGISLAEYVDKEHTKEIRQHRTEELNHFNRIKKKSTKCHVMNTSVRDAKTTTKIFQKYEIKREEFMMNKEEMKVYDLENKGVIAVYLIYAAYEWREISQKMFEMKLFNREEHKIFNLTSLEIFLKFRYGSLICDVAKFSRDKTSSVFNTIHKKLNKVGLVEKYRINNSITHGFYYKFKDEFYAMPIQQVLGLIFSKKTLASIKDPNFLCQDVANLREKTQSYQGKPYSKEFNSPQVRKLKRIKIKPPKPTPEPTPKPSNGSEFIPLEDIGKYTPCGNAKTDYAKTVIDDHQPYAKNVTAFQERRESEVKKINNFDEIVKILNKNGILMKESVIYPNGVIKITYI